MYIPKFLACAAVGAFLLPQLASAERLNLRTHAVLDVSAANIQAFGDLSLERLNGRVWISDGAPNGQIHEFSPTNGALLSTISPAAIPQFDGGPDGLAVSNGIINPRLSVFSSFQESEGGTITQGGSFFADYGTSHGATGADFDMEGSLWIVTGTAESGAPTLRRIDVTTGAILQSIPIVGAQSRAVDVAFDPITNDCYVLFELSGVISQINLTTGIVQHDATITPDVPRVAVGGFDFDATGEFIYVAMGATPADSTELHVLRRDFDALGCSGPPSLCPCGNPSIGIGGCNNSFGTGGATLDSRGVPRVVADTLRFEATRLPPITSCLLFQGTGIPNGGIQAFGDGIRCAGGNVIRLGVTVSSAGTATWPVPGAPPLGTQGAIPSTGATRIYQVWYRNAAAFCTASTFNLSNSLVISWRP